MNASALLLGLAALLACATTMPLHASAGSETRGNAPVLIYIYSPECGACRQFDHEVAPIYHKTDESIASTPTSAGRLCRRKGYRHANFSADQSLRGAGSHYRLLRRGAILAGTPTYGESHPLEPVTAASRCDQLGTLVRRTPGAGGSAGAPAKHWALRIQNWATSPSHSSRVSAMLRVWVTT